MRFVYEKKTGFVWFSFLFEKPYEQNYTDGDNELQIIVAVFNRLDDTMETCIHKNNYLWWNSKTFELLYEKIINDFLLLKIKVSLKT